MGLKKTLKEKIRAAAQRKRTRAWLSSKVGKGLDWATKKLGATKDSKGIVSGALGRRKKKQDDKAWAKKTSNSPAAKAGFSDKERIALKEKHEAFKEKRKAGTHRKKKLTNAEKLRMGRGKPARR